MKFKTGQLLSNLVPEAKSCRAVICFNCAFIWFQNNPGGVWGQGQAAVPQRSAVLVGDLLSCKLTVSVGHSGLCAAAAHWPVVTGLAETEALYGLP